MPPIPVLTLLVALGAPIQPAPGTPSKIATPTTTTGGAPAEDPADTRTSPPAKIDAVVRDILPRLGEELDVTATEQAALDGIVASLRAGKTRNAVGTWKTLVKGRLAHAGTVDPNALVQYVLREAYLQQNEDLKAFADKIAAINAAKKAIRDHLQEVREALAAASKKVAVITMPTIVVCRRCGPDKIVAAGKSRALTRAQWNAYVDELEKHLQAIGDDAQLANVDLQNVLQKQQQTLQMMSSIAKKLHDTAQSVIRKIGG